MSEKQLVGEAKRKSDQAKAREIVNKPKKPTAKELGVGAVVGNRGKIRSENPIEEDPRLKEVDAILDDVEEKLNKLEKRTRKVGVPQHDLNEYFKESVHHHTAEGYALIKEIEMRLKGPWWQLANKGETLPALITRAIKHLATPQPTSTPLIIERKETTPIVSPEPQKAVQRIVHKPVIQREGPSNKEIVYREWIKTTTTPDIASLATMVPDVQVTTIKVWMKAWESGNNLPACAKVLPPTMRGMDDNSNMISKSK